MRRNPVYSYFKGREEKEKMAKETEEQKPVR